MFKVNNKNTSKTSLWCLKKFYEGLKGPFAAPQRCFGILTVNFAHILHLFLVFLLPIVDFEQVNVIWKYVM